MRKKKKKNIAEKELEYYIAWLRRQRPSQPRNWTNESSGQILGTLVIQDTANTNKDSFVYVGVSKSFRTESIKKYMLTTINARREATQRVMAAKLTRLTHKIAIQIHLVAKCCNICSSRFRRTVRELLDTHSYDLQLVSVSCSVKRLKLWSPKLDDCPKCMQLFVI
jgi:hypothetical protein